MRAFRFMAASVKVTVFWDVPPCSLGNLTQPPILVRSTIMPLLFSWDRLCSVWTAQCNSNEKGLVMGESS
jgi:hypothetical protein